MLTIPLGTTKKGGKRRIPRPYSCVICKQGAFFSRSYVSLDLSLTLNFFVFLWRHRELFPCCIRHIRNGQKELYSRDISKMSVFHFSGVIPRGIYSLPIYISRKECVTFLDNIEKDIRACRDKSGKFSPFLKHYEWSRRDPIREKIFKNLQNHLWRAVRDE